MEPMSEPRLKTRLVELLVKYLMSVPGIEHYGTEGMTVEEVVCTCYRSAAEKGWVPCHTELIVIYPELSDEIDHFFLGD